MKCDKCGAELLPGDMFCSNCGNSIQSGVDSIRSTQPVIYIQPEADNGNGNQPQRDSFQSEGRPYSRITAAIVCVVVMIVFVFAGALIFSIVTRRNRVDGVIDEKNAVQQSACDEVGDIAVAKRGADTASRESVTQKAAQNNEPETTVITKESETAPPTTSQGITVNVYPQINITDDPIVKQSSGPEYRSYPGRVIRANDNYSSDVQYIQRLLIYFGYNCGSAGADGFFGTDTAEAVRRFQYDNGIAVDGEIGPVTWDKLQEKLSEYGGSGYGGKWIVSYSTPSHAGVVMRADDTYYSDKIAVLSEGTELQVFYEGDNGYIKVQTPSGQTGWILKKYVEKTE